MWLLCSVRIFTPLTTAYDPSGSVEAAGRATRAPHKRVRCARLTFLTAGPKLLLRGALIHMARSAASMSVIFLSVLVGMAGGNPLGQDSSERPKKADSSKYVGTEVCQGCHEDQYKSFATSVHMHLVKTEKAAEGCEGCEPHTSTVAAIPKKSGVSRERRPNAFSSVVPAVTPPTSAQPTPRRG